MTIPAPTWTPGTAEYHEDFSRWSSSMLRCFNDSPALAYQRYVLCDPAAQRSGTSEALILGSAVNEILLDPAGRNLHVVEVQSRATKAVRDAEQAFPGRRVLTRKEHDLARRIADSILEPRTPAARLAQTLLQSDGGHPEYAHRWEDPSGVPCRTLIDRVIPVHGRPAILELKTSRSPDRFGFRRQVMSFGYHEQAAFNCRGLADALGIDPRPATDAPTPSGDDDWTPPEPEQGVLFYWIVIRNAPPYECYIYRRSEDLRKLGEHAVEEGLAKLADALQRRDDPAAWSLPDEQLPDDEIPEIDAPAWAMDAIQSDEDPDGSGETELD